MYEKNIFALKKKEKFRLT